MNIADYSIKHRVIAWMFLVILAIGGVTSFTDLGRLEYPNFTIKQSMVVAAYPGATAEEVEEELTYPIEQAIRQLPYVKNITSISSPGLAQITVEMKSIYGGEELRQIWDELRRKINDLESSLPSGAYPPTVYDDFGDVFGILYLVTGNNYSYPELKQYVDYLKRDLELVEGVGKVTIEADQEERAFIELSLKKMAALDLDLNTVVGLLIEQNAVLDAGKIAINGESLILRPKRIDSSLDPIIHGSDTGQLIHLSDVATLKRGIQEIPSHIVSYNGKPAISLGISFSKGVNVVEVGKAIDARLAELEFSKPAGIELNTLYNQPKEVDTSVSDFILSLVEAVAIVIVVLLFTMGMRSGFIIGAVLLLTVFGTFIMMAWQDIELQRISLGALIIALGMLVDNAIVVVEGILVGLQKGKSKLQASIDITKQTQWPLLGATVIAITAFAPIGLSADATGEFMGSLFWVLCYSLFLSWITALTLTPFLADLLLKSNKDKGQLQDEEVDPYKGILFVVFRKLLQFSLRFKALTMLTMVALLFGALFSFGFVKNAFFPPSNTPQFYLDVWLPQGTDIRETNKEIKSIEQWMTEQQGVEFVATTTGRGFSRFTLTYAMENSYEAYGQLIVRVETKERMFDLMSEIAETAPQQFPEAQFQLKMMEVGPSAKSKIEARITGPDPDTLRELAAQVENIFNADAGSRNVRHNWRERTKELVPVIDESQARRLGITNNSIAQTLQMAFGGISVGTLRDGTRMLPIMIRLPEEERVDFSSIENLRIWSPTQGAYIPIQQVVNRVEMDWTESLIMRRDRKRTITIMADHDILSDETAAVLLSRLRPKVEALPLPAGYQLNWGGEYETSTEAQTMLFGSLPMGYLFMFIITVFLFNSVRKPIVIWLTVPLSLIGVTVGLLSTNQPFTFTALLGLLSLSGMILKNGIVLMDQINIELSSGKDKYQAVLDSAISRVRPVSMAAVTTILGMIPLIFDAFFASMAVTIMFGLGFATILTLVVVPVLFASFYRISPPKKNA